LYIKENYKKIIKDIIENNKYYIGNEYLFNEFCDEIYQRTYLILSTKNNEEDLKQYLKETIDKIMLNVLKKHQSPAYPKQSNSTSKSEIISLKKMMSTGTIDKINLRKDMQSSQQENNPYSEIVDPVVYLTEKDLNKKAIQSIINTVYEIHEQMPHCYYFQIFYYKYFQRLKQAQIAQKLGITQAELSKRLLELIETMKGYGIRF
jgi:hypothetical protein